MANRADNQAPPRTEGVAPPRGGPIVELREVSKSYGHVRAVESLSLALRPGEVLGLCGHNGAGKSTVIRMLTGLVQPDAGTIELDGRPAHFRGARDAIRAGIALVDQELSLVPELSVHDNILLGGLEDPFFRRRRRTLPKVESLLVEVGLGDIDPDAPAGSLAIGEQQLVEVARLLSREARVVILDEPTATLSDAEIDRVAAVVRAVARRGAAVLYVSHRLGEVLDLCDRACVLRDGRLMGEHEISSLDRRSLLKLIVGEEGQATEAPARPAPTGNTMLKVENLQIADKVRGLSLEVRAGEILGLAGQLGSGAGTALRGLGGLEDRMAANVEVDGRQVVLGSPRRSLAAGIVFTSNDRKREGLFLSQDNRRNLLSLRHADITRLGFVRQGAARSRASHLAGLVGLPVKRLDASAGQLSGGNQQKVLVGRTLERDQTRVLLFDDPTRGVDVGARAEIHNLIRSAAGAGLAVVVASTEMDELLDLCDRILTVFGGRAVSVLDREEATAERVFAEMTMGAQGTGREEVTNG